MSARSKLMVIGFLLLALLVYGGFLFVPYGSVYWPDAWCYMLAQLSMMAIIASWLAKNNPGLLKERMRYGGKGVKGWDRVVTTLFLVLFVVLFSFIAHDVRTNGPSVPIYLKALGYAGLFFTMSVMFWVMRTNSFAARTVKIQKERGQKVVTTGPYAIVRHPMYAGFLVYTPAISLMLGSYQGLPIAALVDIIIIARTYLEDKTLQKELGGYKEYTKKTRYRIIPHVW